MKRVLCGDARFLTDRPTVFSGGRPATLRCMCSPGLGGGSVGNGPTSATSMTRTLTRALLVRSGSTSTPVQLLGTATRAYSGRPEQSSAHTPSCLTGTRLRSVPIVCIQKADAPWTRRGPSVRSAPVPLCSSQLSTPPTYGLRSCSPGEGLIRTVQHQERLADDPLLCQCTV